MSAPRDLPPRTLREIGRALNALRAERFWPVLAGVSLALIFFAACGAWGLWAAVGERAHAVIWAAGMLGLGAVAVRALRQRPKPDWAAAIRRLERDNGAEDRPLSTFDDHAVGGDPAQLEFWRIHRDRLKRRFSAMRAKGPVLRHWRRASGAAGLGLVAILGALAVFGLPLGGARALGGLWPDFGALWGADHLTIEAWATPPDYSGRAPIYLAKSLDGPVIAVPKGSTLFVRSRGGPRPVLRLRTARHTTRLGFSAKGRRVFEAQTVLRESQRVSVRFLGTRAAWRFRVLTDSPPIIRFQSPPVVGPHDSVIVNWRATDDYGVVGAFLEIAPKETPDHGAWPDAERVPLSAAFGGLKAIAEESRLNLVRSRFAGQMTKIRLIARDALGQEGASAALGFKIPEKTFTDPVALALLAIRAQILAAPNDWPRPAPPKVMDAQALRALPDFWSEDQRPGLSRAPLEVRRAARALDAVALYPEDLFIGAAPFLGLRYARGRLEHARVRADSVAAAELLWEVAAAIEGDGRTEAEIALAEAKAALERAIANGAGKEEIEQRLADLREAVRRFIEERARQAEARGAVPEDNAQTSEVNRGDLDKLLRELEDVAKNGSPEEARKALETLAQVLDNLRFQNRPGQSGDGAPQQGQARGKDGREKGGDEALDALADQLNRQRALNDETFKRQQNGQSSGNLADRQRQLSDDLSRALGALDKADKDPGRGRDGGADKESRAAREAIDRAGQAMRQAEEALRREDTRGALDAQQQALKELRAGAESLSRKDLAERRGEKSDSKSKDPLGRSVGGTESKPGQNSVPSEAERKRIRDILDEIRRRAGENARPKDERDYLKRLLDPY